jgi:histone H3/H4
MSTEEKPSRAWKRCGVCKRDLGFEADYYECSVSTCTSGRNHAVFCSVDCWDQHVPVMRHRDAWAEQKRSPTRRAWEEAEAHAAGGAAPARRIVVDAGAPSAPASAATEGDILVVASKLKAYIRARSGMNTSDTVLEELSGILRRLADRAIDQARLEGRRTVMDRDFRTP